MIGKPPDQACLQQISLLSDSLLVSCHPSFAVLNRTTKALTNNGINTVIGQDSRPLCLIVLWYLVRSRKTAVRFE